MTAATPGQAAYEAHAGKMGGRRDAWGELPATYRDAWEAAAQAAVRATPLYAELAKQLAEAVAAQEPRPAPELQAGPCPFDGHDGEHLRLNTHGHWLCAINLTNMLVAADVITDLQPERPAPELAEVTAERDGLRKALHVIRLGIAEPPPKSVAEDALNGRYFDPMNDAGVWRTEPALKAVPAPDALRAGIRELLADVQASADATRPSRETQIEDEVAIALRKLLETP